MGQHSLRPFILSPSGLYKARGPANPVRNPDKSYWSHTMPLEPDKTHGASDALAALFTGASPGYNGAAPDSIGAAPDFIGAAPDSIIGAAPDSIGAPPDSIGAPPDSIGAPPDSTGAAPGSTGATPNSIGASPGCLELLQAPGLVSGSRALPCHDHVSNT